MTHSQGAGLPRRFDGNQHLDLGPRTLLVLWTCLATRDETYSHRSPKWQVIRAPWMRERIGAVLGPRDLDYSKLPRGNIFLQPKLLHLEVPNLANSLA